MTEARGMTMWRCSRCGYIYSEQRGDPLNGIEPGTPFEQLSNFKCPVCGAPKEAFEKLES